VERPGSAAGNPFGAASQQPRRSPHATAFFADPRPLVTSRVRTS
jgi:hypothetical protein